MRLRIEGVWVGLVGIESCLGMRIGIEGVCLGMRVGIEGSGDESRN